MLYGWAIEDEWAKGPVVRTAAGLEPGALQHIAVVSPFPKRWEGQWIYDGGEAERFAHILWQRLPEQHVQRINLPIGVRPEQISEALAAHDSAKVRALLGVDHPIDALVLGSVEEGDFENAFLQGYQARRDGVATAYDLSGQELWHAQATVFASVTHITWKLSSLLAESFPRR